MHRFAPLSLDNSDWCCFAQKIRTGFSCCGFGFFRKLWHLITVLVLSMGVLNSGCSTGSKTTDTARSAIEQLLLAQSLERTLNIASIPFTPGESVTVEAVGLTGDKEFAKGMVENWLREKGVQVGGEAPQYLVRVILHGFGTQNSETFVGIPAIQSTIIPFALPELAIYKNVKQRGYVRLVFEVSDKKTGGLIASSPVFEDDVYYHQFVVLFLITFKSTDILPPPF